MQADTIESEADTIEEMTRKSITVALSVSQLIQDIAKISSVTLLWPGLNHAAHRAS